ncbi:MAG: multidrug transporter AcrB [Coxiellaceae bacterium]|nr:multidrug transporter AcrB [Coxiellaceae bacterium]
MRLSEICIEQPVLAIVLSLLLAVVGVMGFLRLEVLFFPKQVMPIVTVSTSYSGASADLMESQVTQVIETQLAGVDGIKYISSSSSTSSSNITIQFYLGGDLEAQAAQVRDKVADSIQDLPADADMPVVSVGEDGSMLMGIAFTDDKKKALDVRDYLMQYVRPVLQQLSGVGGVGVKGSTNYAMRIWLNTEKMAGMGVSVSDIKTAVGANNIYFPAGSLRGPTRNYSVKSDTYLKNADEFAKVIVKQNGNQVVRLKDVAEVKLGLQSLYDIPVRINNREGVMLTITPLQSANPIAVAKAVNKALPGIQRHLPPGMHAQLMFDNSEFLQSSIDETFKAIVEAVLLVVLVVFLFLGSFRSASIPIVTIPLSLIGVFAIINWLGYSINIMSLLGMVLAIGLVVDDAIVVLENIERHIQEGMSAVEASIKGIREIGYAVIVMTLTLFAVYAPIGFMQGVTAALFKEFAFTLAAAVLISGFIALTLTPMMCSRLLSVNHAPSRMVVFNEKIFQRIEQSYQSILHWALAHRIKILLSLVLIGLLGAWLGYRMPSEFLPQEDYGVVNVRVNTPSGSVPSYADKYTQQVVSIVKKQPGIQGIVTQLNQSSANIYLYLKPWGDRKVTSHDIVADLNKQLSLIPAVDAYASVPDIIAYGEEGSDITLNFLTAQDYRALSEPLQAMLKGLNGYPGIINLQSSLKYDSQEYALTVNRDLAAVLGVSMQDIADTIHAMMSGIHYTDLRSGTNSYRVILQMQKKQLLSFDALDSIYVTSSLPVEESDTSSISRMVPLSSLVTLTPQIGQGTLQHFNRMRSGAITGMVAPGYTESEVIDKINTLLPEALTSKVRAEYSGKAAQYIESAGSMSGIMLLSFIFIYLVLSAQFGSFIDPFIILLAVPLSLVGALFTLWLTGGTFNLFSQIGLVTLVGLVSKHGILITEFTNQLRGAGVTFSDAIIKGATLRLRPILMTTVAMVVGSLPLAFATGPGSVGRQEIGWVIVGGLFFGTFFSLIVVPIAYSYLGRFHTIEPKSS